MAVFNVCNGPSDFSRTIVLVVQTLFPSPGGKVSASFKNAKET